MVNTRHRFALVLAMLPSLCAAQMRVSLPSGSVGALPIPLTPFNSFTAPALSLSPLSVPSLSPSLTLSFAPAPALSAAVPVSLEQGRAYFDGAAAKADAPAPANPARAPRGDSVSLNGVVLPSRMFSDQASISGHL